MNSQNNKISKELQDMIKLVIDNRVSDCKYCGKGVYRDKNLFIDPFRPYSYYHKDCFIDILKNHPLPFVKLD